ncbi:MAG: hypothetical protein HRU12_10105 [Phaeodactylibacter sp.]|nr:hypothetical protein [Phaeodactylibacter sp.]
MIEMYAFITEVNSKAYVESKWPEAIKVGEKHRMVQFTNIDQPKLLEHIESLGCAAKLEYTAEDIIQAMTSEQLGPYVCDIVAARKVVNHFKP